MTKKKKMMKGFGGLLVVGSLALALVLSGCARNLEEDLPSVMTSGILSLTETSFESGGNVTDEGVDAVTKRGICWNTVGAPKVTGSTKTVDGTGLGVYRSRVTGLLPGTKYFYRAYATNSAGTKYGAEFYTTTKQSVTVPTTTTLPISDIELTTAVCGGIVVAHGGDSVVRCGICWDVNPDPTTSSAGKVVLNYSTPVFNCTLTGLKHSTNYYVRSYAVNTKGVAYGENIMFTTKVLPEIAMASIPGGLFQMGSYSGSSNEQPVHWVTLNHFKMGVKEVTVELWNAVMPNAEFRNIQNNLPISNVTFNDVMTFITRLGLATNTNYRLPTEAEWEYVAGEGADNRTLYAAGLNDTVGFAQRAWYEANADGTVHPVGTLQANKLGLYDLAGNVKEWCVDWYGDYDTADATNPKGQPSGSMKVLRGGAYPESALNNRVSKRAALEPNKTTSTIGFRIALSE